MSFMEQQELLRQLTAKEQEGKLTPKGQKVLDTLRAGPSMAGPVASLAAGATFETADELAAFVRSVAGADYDTALTQERQNRQQYRSENPASATVLEVGGAVVPALGVGAAKTIAGAAGIGAGFGGLTGFGAGEDGLTNRAISGAAGAVAGGVLGAGTQAVFNTPFGMAYRAAVERLRGPSARGNQIGDESVKRALEADAGSVEAAMAAQRAGAEGGRPFALADVGANSAGTLDAAKTLPGQGKQDIFRFLQERDRGMVTRLSDDVKAAFGTSDEYLATFRALEQARKAGGNALYARALAMPIDVSAQPLTSLLSRPSFKSALAAGQRIYRDRGLPLPQPGEINMELLHIAKIGLDDLIGKAKTNPQGIGRQQLGAFMQIKDDLLSFMDDQSQGAYAAARSQWAGDSAVMDAMATGRSVFESERGLDFDLLAEQVRRMSASEKQAFRNGSMAAVIDQIEGGSGDLASKLVRTESRRKLLRLMFDDASAGDRQFATWMNNLEKEIAMKRTNMTNSLTASRQEAITDIRDRVAGDRAPEGMGLAGLIVNSMQRAAADSRASFDQRTTEAVAARIANVLTELDPAKLKQIQDRLTGRANIYQAIKAIAPELLPAVARAVTGPAAVGGMAGREAGRFDPTAAASFVMEQ